MPRGRSGQPGHGAGPSQRQLRVGEMLRHALAEILQRGDVSDPVLETVAVTVPEVRVSPDLKHATVYVMPLGGRHADEVVAALDHHARYLRGQLARRVTLKFMPDLRFEIDRTFDAADHVDRLLRTPEVARDLGPKRDED